MDEDDLLGHLGYDILLAHKLAFIKGVHVIEKYNNLSDKGFSKESIRFIPEAILF